MMSSFSLLLRAIRYKISDYRAYGPKTGKDAFSREKAIYPFRQLTHPLQTYNDLKFENKSSLRITFISAALFFIVRLLDQAATAALFRTTEPRNINVFLILTTTVGLLLIWTVCNWATCTLAGGEGTFRNIWVMTAYSVLPYCLLTLISIGMSHVLSQSEAVFYTTVRGFGLVWTGLLLFLGMMTAHQYTVLKTVVSIILTLVMIVLCCFLLATVFSVSQQIRDFVVNIFTELLFRR